MRSWCCNELLTALQVQFQRSYAELARSVDLRLLSLKCVQKVIFVLRDRIRMIPLNNCEYMKNPSN